MKHLYIALQILILASIWLGCSQETSKILGELKQESSAFLSRLSPTGGGKKATPLKPQLATRALPNFDDAPRTPDVDDPAIWKSRTAEDQVLVIGTLKNAGLEVYDLKGQVVQTISVFNRPAIAAKDPPAPGKQPDAATTPCPGSESGEQFGRFNNIDISYGFELTKEGEKTRTVDIAVVSDRGCDVLWVFEIDPSRKGGPLFDITAANAPRAFPEKRVQPSPVQSPGKPTQVVANPIDDQDTAYGLDLFGEGDEVRAVVSQERRATIGIFRLMSTAAGRVTYTREALLNFPNTFKVPNPKGKGTIDWAACREDPAEDLQFEGLVVDEDNEILYATQEIIGVWAIDLSDDLKGTIEVPEANLAERVVNFGAPFFAVPDDGEFQCLDKEPAGGLPAGSFVGPGNSKVGGKNLTADVEGATIYYADGDEAAYLIVSSQGSSSFQVYDLEDDELTLAEQHRGGFQVDGVGSTDGLDVSHLNLGGAFNEGMLVIQNGEAPPPASTDPINGFEFDGSSQLIYLRWSDVARQFNPPLLIKP